jgi:hypothetical protein
VSELEMIRAFAALPRNVQRAASRLAADMSEHTAADETHVVLEVLVGAGETLAERRVA